MVLSPLIILAFAAPFVAAGRQRGLAVLAVWSVVLVGFYAFYYHSGETWWYLRFILPAFLVFIVAALTVLESVRQGTRSRPGTAAGALALLLVLAAGWQIAHYRQLDVLHLKEEDQSYPDAAEWAQKNLPAKSAVFCMQVSGAFFYYTDFLLFRWDQIPPEKYGPLLGAIAGQDRPVYAALYEFETPAALEKIGGKWTKLATVGQATFWQRQP